VFANPSEAINTTSARWTSRCGAGSAPLLLFSRLRRPGDRKGD